MAEEVLGDAEEVQQADKNIFWELQREREKNRLN